MDDDNTTIRAPRAEDGHDVHQLIAACPPLDTNSAYCNLLQCSHFAQSSALAICATKPMGFVSGYTLPEHPSTLFIWQVAVHPDARGMGLGKAMIKHILQRDFPASVTSVHTTITAENDKSHCLFNSLARDLSANITTTVMFDRDQHFGGKHATEVLWQIGPFAPISRNPRTCNQ